MKFNFAELTDIGLVRKANEDSVGHLLLQDTNGYATIFIVCDGMGGHVGGARASQSAVRNIKEYFINQPNSNPQIALKEAIEFANMQIFAEAQSNPDFSGMGTTVTVLIEKEGFINIAHVGDSRIYINSDDILYRITKDHSFVQGLVDAGQLKDEEMELHPRKNELTRALGISSTVEVEVNSTPILAKKGDKFMLCSDGLCGLVNDTTMMQTINEYKNINRTANELITLAKNAGGHDNISVTIIDVLVSEHTTTKFTDKSNVKLNKLKGITGTREVSQDELKGGTSERINSLMKNMMLPAIITLFVLGGGFFVWNYIIGDNLKAIKGCTDKNALNYNKKATVDNNTCKYKPENPNPIPKQREVFSVKCESNWSYQLLSENLTKIYTKEGFEACKTCQSYIPLSTGDTLEYNDSDYQEIRSNNSVHPGDILFVYKDDLQIQPNHGGSTDISTQVSIQERLKSVKEEIERKKPKNHSYNKSGYTITFKKPSGQNNKKWNHIKGAAGESHPHTVNFTVEHKGKKISGKYTCTYTVEPNQDDLDKEKLEALKENIKSRTDYENLSDDDKNYITNIDPKKDSQCEEQNYRVILTIKISKSVREDHAFDETIPADPDLCEESDDVAEIKELLNNKDEYWVREKLDWTITKLKWELKNGENLFIDERTIGDVTLYHYELKAKKLYKYISNIRTKANNEEYKDFVLITTREDVTKLP